MTTKDILVESVCTLITVEKNCDKLAKNLEVLLNKHIEFCREADTLQEQYDINTASFQVLCENLMEFLDSQKKLLMNNRKACREIVKKAVGATE